MQENQSQHVRLFFKNVVLGGSAACCTCFFTNPLDVVKIRMQLQGELKARGQHAKFYRNPMQAMYVIARTDGLVALQKGFIPALHYQFFMNGFRLGSYQMAVRSGLTKDKDGKVSLLLSIVYGAMSGSLGALTGSPFYMVKVHLQAQAKQEIAVGHQHTHENMRHAFKTVFKEQGGRGLYRGVNAAIPAVTVGSATQLSSFSFARDFLTRHQILQPDSLPLTLTSTCFSGVCLAVVFTPFDVVSTRLYNQGVSSTGTGLFYKGFFDCFYRIFQTEGILGFYKGIVPSFLRLVPHTILCLSFWDRFSLYFMKSSKQ
ncbi:hypothetical protein FSP39_023618 [Pinctada imbricata]|uniref:Solute carrier family 25 member 35 n=1 Tax=Pinctada imbricata TaxID=66713 RepID=A0AA88YCP5_PINIB|nr:hypothetical protein FSP39_023618 [Pinctada imbricata]